VEIGFLRNRPPRLLTTLGKSGGWMATIKDVATLAGVAPSVVSRLLNGDATLRVRPETRDRIHDAVARLRYTPNVAARSLRAGRSGAIAMALHDVVNPVYSEIVAGAQQAAAGLDQALLLGDVDSLAQGTGTLMRMIHGGAIDGLVMQGASRPSDEVLARFATKVSTVMLQEDPRPGITVVGLADEEAGRVATQHLLDLEHTRIGCITTVRGTRPARDRLRGWRHRLRSAGIEVRLVAAVDCGYTVPDDLSVVAIHDIPMAEFVRPALTTVRLPLNELGRRAVGLLSPDGHRAETSVVVTEPAPTLVVRASTAPRR
jgi:LacI family transcriptional regulator